MWVLGAPVCGRSGTHDLPAVVCATRCRALLVPLTQAFDDNLQKLRASTELSLTVRVVLRVAPESAVLVAGAPNQLC